MGEPSVGDIFEGAVRDGSKWIIERRLVLDVTDSCVLYQLVFDPPEGTHVLMDETANTMQTTMKKWGMWAETATKFLE